MKCACKTKSGKKCSRNAEENSKYCWQHSKAPGPKSPKKSPRKLTGDEEEKQITFCRCVNAVKAKGGGKNPWAICTASVGRITNSCKEYE